MSQQLLEQILQAKHHQEAMQELLIDYQPFIEACIKKYAFEQPEEFLTVGQMAFVKAVETYEEEKGNFLKYCELIIKSRIIDEGRKHKRYTQQVALADEEEHELVMARQSHEVYRQQEEKEKVAMEIQELNQKLQKYDISFFQLAELSPKHQKAREECMKIIQYISMQKVLCQDILHGGKLPVKLLVKNVPTSKKTLENFRKYIIAVLLILSSDFEILRQYIPVQIKEGV